MQSAGRVAAIAIDNERLTAELIANQAALRLSRARIVEAGDRERQRIAQNLHDGIQVELVLLAMRAQELRHAGSAAVLDVAATQLRNGIDDAANHLRELVHAVMPAGLDRAGADGRGRGSGRPHAAADQPRRGRRQGTAVAHRGQHRVLRGGRSAGQRGQARRGQRALGAAGADRDRSCLIEVADDGVGGAASARAPACAGLLDRVDVLGGQLAIGQPARLRHATCSRSCHANRDRRGRGAAAGRAVARARAGRVRRGRRGERCGGARRSRRVAPAGAAR